MDFERDLLDFERDLVFLDREGDRLLDLDLDLRLRSLDFDLRGRDDDLRRLDLDRLDRDLERERLLLPLDRDRDLLELRLSFVSIPITGSIEAFIMFWASLNRDMASSISFWAASLLFACGLMMGCVAC